MVAVITQYDGIESAGYSPEVNWDDSGPAHGDGMIAVNHDAEAVEHLDGIGGFLITADGDVEMPVVGNRIDGDLAWVVLAGGGWREAGLAVS